MNSGREKTRYLALYPHRRGLSYVVFDGDRRLCAYGRRWIESDKSRRTLMAYRALVERFRPDQVILEDASDSDSPRRAPMKRLFKRLEASAKRSHLSVHLVSRPRVHYAFLGRDLENKDDRAILIAQLYPLLQRRLPLRREVWMAESESMGVFDAMALGLSVLGVPEEPVEDELERMRRRGRR